MDLKIWKHAVEAYYPAEKELQYFAENCSILQKNVVILQFTLVFHYYIYFTVVYPCKTVVLPSLFFQN